MKQTRRYKHTTLTLYSLLALALADVADRCVYGCVCVCVCSCLQFSWWDRSWATPFLTMMERALALLPGMNYFTSQLIFNYHGLSFTEFVKLTEEEADNICRGTIRKEQLVHTHEHTRTMPVTVYTASMCLTCIYVSLFSPLSLVV